MARDFTLDTYRSLLKTAIENGYTLTSYEDFITNSVKYSKVMILRHDVDDLPKNSFDTAQIEKELGAKGSYYFRIVKQSFDLKIIGEIKALGHEIGYHYENMDHCHGNVKEAYNDFCKHLDTFHKLYPIKTICMHGSPLSKWDNKDLWKTYSYKELGIQGEPYFDLDFNKILYITDTGRSWNKTESSVRDKVQSGFQFKFDTTDDIIIAFKNKELPNQIMLNIHPQRWTDNQLLWIKEYIIQNLKNCIKKILVKNK